MLVTAYQNGATAGVSGDHVRTPGKRTAIKGWTASAVRRHTRWLYSIDAPALDASGFAVTLTVRDCPPDAAAWDATRKAFFKRMTRRGMIRYHWVTEWQRRGVPHLHCALYFPEGTTLLEALQMVLGAWIEVAAVYGASTASQDVKSIDGAVGWLQYLSKHASRGVNHYQRNGKPEGWETTGRLWGKGGDWPVEAPMKFELERKAGYRFRRMVRAWSVAQARNTKPHPDPLLEKKRRKRIAWTKDMLKCSDPALSYVRGISGWVPDAVSMAFITLLIEQGEGVTQRD